MIDLGLRRISRLVKYTPQNWKAIHVAGTNGKGSICAYLSAMLHASGVRCGRFTSPHLVDRWDCIAIDEQPISKEVFIRAENKVYKRNRSDEIGASEFEMLTATAFEVFGKEKVDMGVVEVGLGGWLDATNVVANKAVTVISKIGLDHQAFLGDTIEAIARQKAGIMRPGVPCVLDKTNIPSVQDVIQSHADQIGAQLMLNSTDSSFLDELSGEDLEPHQLENLACAYNAFQLACRTPEWTLRRLLPAIQNVYWPGRLQKVDIRRLVGRPVSILLDGAHNVQSAEALGFYVDRRLRTGKSKVTWVLAASEGKELAGMLKQLIKTGDSVAAVTFGPVDHMPWVAPMTTQDILAFVSGIGVETTKPYDAGNNIFEALQWATAVAADGPIVVAGSLYLVSDVLRLLREAEKK